MWWGWPPKVAFAANRAEVPGRRPSESGLPPGRWRGAWRVREQVDVVTGSGVAVGTVFSAPEWVRGGSCAAPDSYV